MISKVIFSETNAIGDRIAQEETEKHAKWHKQYVADMSKIRSELSAPTILSRGDGLFTWQARAKVRITGLQEAEHLYKNGRQGIVVGWNPEHGVYEVNMPCKTNAKGRERLYLFHDNLVEDKFPWILDLAYYSILDLTDEMIAYGRDPDNCHLLESEVKREFRLLSRAHHPDKCTDKESDTFAIASNAYTALKNRHNRQMYDLWGSRYEQQMLDEEDRANQAAEQAKQYAEAARAGHKS